MKPKKLKSPDFLKKEASRLLKLRRNEPKSAWIAIIENPENWDKLDIRIQQKSGQWKRLRRKNGGRL